MFQASVPGLNFRLEMPLADAETFLEEKAVMRQFTFHITHDRFIFFATPRPIPAPTLRCAGETSAERDGAEE